MNSLSFTKQEMWKKTSLVIILYQNYLCRKKDCAFYKKGDKYLFAVLSLENFFSFSFFFAHQVLNETIRLVNKILDRFFGGMSASNWIVNRRLLIYWQCKL